jgi:oligopeptide transport system ATP-binding protein
VRVRWGGLLERVGLSAESVRRFPHEFSGGQRQRIGIARALAARPELIVADEPVSALDVSVQAQVVNLMKALQTEFGFSYVFIAHDLAVVNFISDRVGVMYLGKLVELADRKALFSDPQHPYTRALLAAIPVSEPALRGKKVLLSGELPSPRHPPPGCNFCTRCPLAFDRCFAEAPAIVDVGDGRQVACHLLAQHGQAHPLSGR